MSAEAYKSRIGSAMSNRDFGEVEAAWREFASMEPEAYAYLLNIASQLVRHDKGALAGELCLSLAQTLPKTRHIGATARQQRRHTDGAKATGEAPLKTVVTTMAS